MATDAPTSPTLQTSNSANDNSSLKQPMPTFQKSASLQSPKQIQTTENDNTQLSQSKSIPKGSLTPNTHSHIVSKLKNRHKHTLSPATAQYLNNHSQSFPDIDLNDTDLSSLSEKKKKNKRRSMQQKWKRTLSSDNLLNTARSLSSYKSRAITKMKNKSETEIHRDSPLIKQAKANLESFNAVSQILELCKKVHLHQLRHIQSMKDFSDTIHSSVDLGRNRGNSNTNYFGQYLKMMASTLQSIQSLSLEHSHSFNEFLIEPFESVLENENEIGLQWQLCKNVRYEYSKVKHSFNQNSNDTNKAQLEEIEKNFIFQTNTLVTQRQEKLTFALQNFEMNLLDFAERRKGYLAEKKVINGYDEMKANKTQIIKQIKEDMLYVNNEAQWEEHTFKQFSILLFHRDKFPPSMKFLMETFAPLAAQNNTNDMIEWVRVDYKCKAVLDRYNVTSFPTCLVFVNGERSNEYKPIVGNGQTQSDEFRGIVDYIVQNCSNKSGDGSDEENVGRGNRGMAVDGQML